MRHTWQIARLFHRERGKIMMLSKPHGGIRIVLAGAAICCIAFAASFLCGYIRASTLVRMQSDDVAFLISSITNARVAIERCKDVELEAILHDFIFPDKMGLTIEEHSDLVRTLHSRMENL